MNIKEAKKFLKKLKNENLMYHLDDAAEDCLKYATTAKKAKEIQKTVNKIHESELDWGKYSCPIGYCLHIMNLG